jgi:DNA-binding Lrp family transcriptional regulator
MELDALDQRLIAAVQGGLPLAAHPYALIAAQLDVSEEQVISRLRALLDRGLIKRWGVVVRHAALGYRANAMVVWDVPDAIVDEIGRRFAAIECITLCYRRARRPPHWPYNLYSMIHGKERTAVLANLDEIRRSVGVQDIAYDVLFSGQCFKQRGARYPNAAIQSPIGGHTYG